MKEIENLDTTILAAERMWDFFRAFEGIPEVLKALQAAQNYPRELDKAVKEKQAMLKQLAEENSDVQRLNEKLAARNAELVKELEACLEAPEP